VEDGEHGDDVERLRDSQNAHDAEGMAALFADDYDSQQPVHPSRAFGGRAQVLQNWTSVFQGVRISFPTWCLFTAAGDTEWGEWYWHGHHVDGSQFAMRGVTIMVIHNDRISGLGSTWSQWRQRVTTSTRRYRSCTSRRLLVRATRQASPRPSCASAQPAALTHGP
jgi:hypothetical protein